MANPAGPANDDRQISAAAATIDIVEYDASSSYNDCNKHLIIFGSR